MGNSQPIAVLPKDSMSVWLIPRDVFFRADLTCVPSFQDLKESLHVRVVSEREIVEGGLPEIVVVSHRPGV